MSWLEFIGGLIIGVAIGFESAVWLLTASGDGDWEGDQ